MNKPSVSAGVVAGVALGAAALGAAAVAVRAACLQVARTRNGLARVKRVHDEGGDEIRVLVQGSVYQLSLIHISEPTDTERSRMPSSA